VGSLVDGTVGTLWGAVAGAAVFAVLVNVVNFMDGINGITAATMTVWGVTAMLVSRSHDVPGLLTLGALTAGCALGFLPWNAPVARLFLGDVGSYLFGGLVAGGVVLGWHSGAAVAALLAPMSIYLVDTGSTLVRRARRGESLLTAHRDHVYQRVVAVAALPHFVVAAAAAALAATVTAMWMNLAAVPAAVGTVLVALVYLGLPRVAALSRRGGRA
jgi:UDP-N-acetylmuramyl pentapeptide phosphotransferase/UDP-N-acetylglucosamine-1-phosphate transferase